MTATFNILNYTLLHSKAPIELIFNSSPSFVQIWRRQTDRHWRLPIRFQQVGCLAHHDDKRTMLEHQIILMEIQQAKRCNSGNPRMKFIHHQGIVTCLRSHHFQALCCSSTLPHSTWQEAHNQALVQPKNIRVMGHRGKDTTSPEELMVDL